MCDSFIKIFYLGLPWWRSGWESACQCRAHGFEPWSGKIPHAAEQLSPWATITEPAHLEPVLRNGRGRDSERPAHRDEERPPLAATGESPRTETKTQHSQKLKKKKKYFIYSPTFRQTTLLRLLSHTELSISTYAHSSSDHYHSKSISSGRHHWVFCFTYIFYILKKP